MVLLSLVLAIAPSNAEGDVQAFPALTDVRADRHKWWKEDLDIEPGKTFGGIGFETVVKALRSQLAPGEHVDLRAVAFTPKPRTARVTVTRDGNDPVRMAGRTIPGDRYTIH